MSIFRDFEKKLESLFEGVLLRAFKSGVHPVELGKKLTRELEGHKTIGVKRVYVPNRYEVGLSRRDYSRFESYQSVLVTELENLLISYIKEKGYSVFDRPAIRLKEDNRLREGDFTVRCYTEGEPPGGPGESKPERHRGPDEGKALLELADSGDIPPVFELGEGTVGLGRTPDNDIVLPDPNVSRVHALIEHRSGGYVVRDLGSTNGTWVNERRVDEVELQDGDTVRLGGTRLVFRRSLD